MKLESGGPAVRSSTVLTTPADLLARPAPLGLGDARVRVASSLADLTRRPDPQAAWIVPSFQLVDELVRRGVDSSHVLVVDPLLLRSPELSTAVFSYGDVLVPGAPHRFPGRDLVVVPTYNERECLPIVLAQIPRFLHCDVLVVDDGSPDGTGELADRIAAEQPFVHVLHRTRKQGLGKAYVAGFRWGLERGYDRLYEMDADQSHAPWDLPRLAFAAQTADLVIGSRYVKGGDTRGWSRKRRLLSRCGNLYARLWLGFGVNDWTAGYRCMRADALRQIDLDHVGADGYAFQIEMAWRFRRLGLRIAELPVHFVDRNLGKSKMSTKIAIEAVRKVPGLRLRA